MLCRILLGFASGVAAVALFNSLPHPGWPAAGVAMVLLTGLRLQTLWPWSTQLTLPLAALLLGICHASHTGLSRQSRWLPERLAGQDLTITGRIIDLPYTRHERTRFTLEVTAAQQPVRGRLSLVWSQAPELFSGQIWRLRVRLRPPHGFGSPGANDYEAALLQRQLVATGYVRTSGDPDNCQLGDEQRPLMSLWRARLARWLQQHIEGPGVPLLLALLLGHAGELEDQDWTLFRQTGTVHLLVVSGLHISLAVLVAAWLVRGLALLGLVPLQQIPVPTLVPLAGLVLACLYGFLAGFGLPIQRALVMLGTALIGNLAGFRLPLSTLYCLALCAVLCLDPMAVTARGFWLSFAAVAALLYRFSYRRGAGMGRLFTTQVAVALALTPLLAGMQQATSLLAPVVNLVSVPLIGLVLMPLMATGLLMAPLLPQAAGVLLQWSAAGLALWKQALAFVPVWLPPDGFLPVPGPGSQLAALLGVLLLLSPPPLGWRATGVLCLCPWLFPSMPLLPTACAELVMLDVGQGLALVIRTRHHVLVYDTGDRFSPSFTAAGAVMIPWLRRANIRQLDLILISHGDRDHIGGLDTLRQQYPTAMVWHPAAGEGGGYGSCGPGQRWSWDGVDFEVLSSQPAANDSTNDSSCVLRICAGTDCALLTGDISRRREAELVRNSASRLRSRVLQVPHHGSSSSSSALFLDQVRPELALVSAGYYNRFRHPAASVVRRLQERGIRVLVTARTGTQWVRLGDSPDLGFWREHCRGWWRGCSHQPPGHSGQPGRLVYSCCREPVCKRAPGSLYRNNLFYCREVLLAGD